MTNFRINDLEVTRPRIGVPRGKSTATPAWSLPRAK